jgi:hypothetical protein
VGILSLPTRSAFVQHAGRLAALIPPLRVHRYRCHGVLAPNPPLRSAAIGCARYDASSGEAPIPETISIPTREEGASCSAACYLWAMLLARLFESPPLRCPNCGADMRIVAFITEALVATQGGAVAQRQNVNRGR